MAKSKKLKKRIKPIELPCGEWVVAEREANIWKIWTGDCVEEVYVSYAAFTAVVDASSIPQVIEMLKQMYNNSPLKSRLPEVGEL